MTDVTWEFDLNIESTDRDVTVTTPELDQVIHSYWNDTGVEYETVTKEAGGTIRKTVETTWDSDSFLGGLINPRRETVTTTIGGLKKTTEFAYDSELNVTEIEETDWYSGGSGTAIMRKNFWYTTINALPFQRLSAMKVSGINPANQQFELQSFVEYDFDQGTLASTSPVFNKSAVTGDRGNITTIRRYRQDVDCGTYPAECTIETFEYDDLGNVVTMTDAEGHDTFIDYDDNFIQTNPAPDCCTFAFPTLVTDAEGYESETVYDFPTGLIKKTIDVRGFETIHSYDAMNRLVSVVAPEAGSSSGTQLTTYTFVDATPLVREEVDVDGTNVLKSETVFDKFYRPLRSIAYDPAGNIYTDTAYDDKGRVEQVSLPYRSGGSPEWITTTYDALDRPLTVTNLDETAVQFAYTANTVTQTDEAGRQRRMTYNTLGHLTKAEEPNPTLSSPLTTSYTYYVSGALASVNQSGQTRAFTHDWLGRLLTETHPESGTTTYADDDDGLVATRTDARSVVTTYTYDETHRLLTASYSDSTPTVTRTYDSAGCEPLLCSVDDAVGITTFTYSDAGLLLSEARLFDDVDEPGNPDEPFTATYDYDRAGRLVSITYPSGRVVTRSYQASGNIATNRLDELEDVTTSTILLDTVSENAAGQTTSQTLGNAVIETRSYNGRYQLTGIAAEHNSTDLLNLGYSYDTGVGANTGRIRSRSDAIQPEHSVQYTYDSIYRLIQARHPNQQWGVTWQFDAFGNRTSQTPTGLATGKVGSQTIGYTNNKNTAMTYDSSGNVTNDGSFTYAYDGESRMKSVGGGTILYAYDGDGRMVRRTVSSTSTYYLYGLTGLMSEFTTVNTGAATAASDDRLQYRVAEQTGTAVLLTSANGTVVGNNRVLPYGELWSTLLGSTNDKKFTTYLRDPDTLLDYALARYYRPVSGHFMSRDPYSAGASLYSSQS